MGRDAQIAEAVCGTEPALARGNAAFIAHTSA
jgi:hypothetical protein